MEILLQKGYRVVGVSPDSVASHRRFMEKYGLNFPLLSDPDSAVARAYGAYGEKKVRGRTAEGIIRSTFLLDEEGRVRKAWYRVKAKGHVAQILEELKSLESGRGR